MYNIIIEPIPVHALLISQLTKYTGLAFTPPTLFAIQSIFTFEYIFRTKMLVPTYPQVPQIMPRAPLNRAM